jgi:hypothetical protein
MKSIVPISLLCVVLTLFVSSCSTIKLTRIEEDTYTVTQRDTTIVTNVAHPPGTRQNLEPQIVGRNPNNNGAIFPSTRVTQIQRDKDQQDSVVTREYPNFIRYGLFESAGLLFTTSDNKVGGGPFGIFFDLNELFDGIVTGEKQDAFFTGGMYRFMPTEYRLRWFNDDPDWSIGTYAFEWLVPQAIIGGADKSVMSFLPLYLRKRFYLRREIPYVAITPTVGLGYLGSQYANLGVTADIGSVGGLNLRAYAGYVMNFTPNNFIGSSFPYFGFGTSVLDFLNLQEETEQELKDMKHSAWNIGLVQLSVLNTSSESTMFQPPNPNRTFENTFFRGLHFRIAPTTIALPLLNYQLYAGTSLMSFTSTGWGEWSYAILPLRIGFWQPLIMDEMTVEPFFELGYVPNPSYNFGTKLNFRLNDNTTLGLTAGFITASGILNGKTTTSQFILEQLGAPTDFSRFYMGISVGIFDKIFSKSELRYFK